MNTPAKTLALLIDGDNVQLKYAQHIMRFCETYGSLNIKKVYGDWKQAPLAAQRQKVIELGITPVQQDRTGKNATDFALAMDAALILENENVDIYFQDFRSGIS